MQVIEIEAPDGPSYQMIAHLIDQPHFIKEVDSLRNCWNKLLKNENSLRNYRKTEQYFYSSYIDPVINRLRLNIKFRKVIMDAVLHNRITLTGNISCFPIQTAFGDLAIVIGKDTTKEELWKVYEKLKKDGEPLDPLYQNIPLNDLYISESGKMKLPKGIDVYSEVINHRTWYWLNKPKQYGGEGLSYTKIALKILEARYSDNQQRIDKAIQLKDTVRKGIKAYQCFLKRHYIGTLPTPKIPRKLQ